MVKTSDLVAGECSFKTLDGKTLTLHALSLEDVQHGIEQIQEAMMTNARLRSAIIKLTTVKGKPSTSELIGFVSAALPLITQFTDLFSSACGKDGKWLVKRPLNELLQIITKITELTRPEETLPLFFGLFQMWKGAFQAMRAPATS